MTCTHTSTLGVYLLGALEPEERSHFEGHLSRCEVCRAELVRLAPLPGLLNQITIADFDALGELPQPPAESPFPAFEAHAPVATLAAPVVFDPPPAPPEPDPAPTLAPISQPARPEPMPVRRYWRRALAAAAAVIGLTAGGIVAYESLKIDPAPPVQSAPAIIWGATNPENGVHAEARMIAHDWGTEIQIRMFNVPPGESCRLVVWAKGMSGYKETAGWWATPPGEPARAHPEIPGTPHPEIPGSTSIALSMISKLEVVSEDSVLLVDIPRPT